MKKLLGVFLLILAIIGFILLFSFIIMLLWNNSVTKFITVCKTMNYWQAVLFYLLVILLTAKGSMKGELRNGQEKKE